MVKVSGDKFDLTRVDLSIMPSLECNLSCTFCMYSAGPNNFLTLDVEQTHRFLETVDWDIVPVCGFYGGEPSVDMELYDIFVNMIPDCDGVYPVVGSIFKNTFDEVFKAAVLIRQQGCVEGILNVNDLLEAG